MRPIKFRVLDKDGDMRFPPPVNEWDFNDCKYFSEYTNEKTPVMQFTGLFDKNGVEIYEGDIVRHLYTRDFDTLAIGVIEWSNRAQWRHSRYREAFLSGGQLEVIGNIYENEDLLPETNDE